MVLLLLKLSAVEYWFIKVLFCSRFECQNLTNDAFRLNVVWFKCIMVTAQVISHG